MRLPDAENLVTSAERDDERDPALIVRGPGVPVGATVDLPTLNVDFAPTFLELAGIPIAAGVDGRSLVPLLGTSPPAATSWRQSVFLEHAADVPMLTFARQGIASTLEPDDVVFVTPPPPQSAPPFDGIRTAKYTFVEYGTGEKERFDHAADPAQLVNLAATADPTLLTQLAGIVHGLHGCQGEACRTAEVVPAP